MSFLARFRVLNKVSRASGKIMSFFARFRILTKILSVIALLGVMMLGGIWLVVSRLGQIDAAYSAFLSKDARASTEIARLNRNVIEIRYLTYRLIAEPDAEAMHQVQLEIDSAFEENQRLIDTIRSLAPASSSQLDGIAAEMKKVHGELPAFVKAALANKREEVLRLQNIRLRPHFEDAGDNATLLRTNVDDVIQKGSAELTAKAKATIRLSWIVAAFILTVGPALGLFIAQFGIAKPMRALVVLLQRMAKGEEIEITGTERKDEVGETARAVDEIKAMLAEKACREAEAKAEQDRLAATEREAAMEKMAQEFEAAVGGIVKAAVAGDFAQRVDLEGKTGLVLNIGTAINSLCENVAKALDDLITMLDSLAEGNLTQRITTEYQGNFAILKDNANKTAERIGATIAEIKSSAAEVTSASAEISTSTTDLSQRTEEQAASLEETSASMEEISTTVKKNAENAQQAKQSAVTTREIAERGGQVVAKAVGAMAKINESSRKISDIIGVIDEIARQTNLLALNAAVEAARAGDAGRGFAVVASEVRSLAQRASQAAKDIKDLITNSTDQVKEGVELVNKAGASLSEIVESIKKVADIVADIANASNEQAAGIEQVGKALTHMDEVTQQNSALVEENAATAKTLEHQAQAMDERVAFFRIDSAVAVGQTSQPVMATHAAPLPPVRGPAAKPQPVDRQIPTSAPKRAAAKTSSGGPVGRMQAQLASAINQDQDWKEF